MALPLPARLLGLVCISSLLAGVRVVADPAVAGPPVASPVGARRLGAPLTLDGRLDEPDWQSGEWYGGFHVLNRPGEQAAAQTRFKVRFDAHRLYVGIEAEEPHPDQMRREVMERDGPASRDDCVEVMVDATGGRVEYYHFIVNGGGTLYDAQLRQGGHVRSSEWNSTAVAAAHVYEDRWSAELAVPLVELGITPASTGAWAINVTRERRVGGNELSTYAPMTGGFHQAALYARLRLEDADLSAFLWDLPYPHASRIAAGEGGLEYTTTTRIANGTGRARRIQARARLGDRTGPWVRVRLAAGASQDVEVRVPGIDLGTQILRLELSAAGDPTSLMAVRQIEITARYQPLGLEVLRPFYRNSIFATEALSEIVLRAHSDLDGDRLEQLQLRATLADAHGGVVASATPGTFREEIALPLPDEGLIVGEYELAVTLADTRSGETQHRAAARLRKLPPVADEWRLDEELVLRHNGAPILPFGWFSIPPEAMADTGHTYCLMQSYSAHWQTVAEVRAFLDRAVAAGTAVTIYPYPYPQFVNPASIWGKPLTSKEEEDLRQRVRALKDHPGLFAWYMADEPELKPALPERCRRIYEIVRDEDPYHPCIMLNDTEAGIYKYRDGGDILMPDPYPLFLQGGLAARPLDKVGRFIGASMDAGRGRQAAWITPQGFNYGDYGQENNRGPNLVELRNQLYQAAVYGARGFLWYTYSQALNYPDLDIGMRWLSREVADLKPYLLAPIAEAGIGVGSRQIQHLHTSLRRVGDHLTLIAVSTATEGREVTLRVPEFADLRQVHVVSENRTIPIDDGVLTDRFAVYETHIYTTDPELGERPSIDVPIQAIAVADAARRKDGNLAFEAGGVRVEVSSKSASGSTPTRLTDGVTVGMRWRDGTPGRYPDWLQMTWPAKQRIGRLAVYGEGYTSIEALLPDPEVPDTEISVTRESDDEEGWVAVASGLRDHAGPVILVLNPPRTTDRLRLSFSGNAEDGSHTIVYEVEAYAH